jgi:16S rRNA U516 pseudouridylate synthase RsuA-like enzyme
VRRDILRHVLFQTGHPVEKLRRINLASLELGDLPEGQARAVTPGELRKLEQHLARLEDATSGRSAKSLTATHSKKET